MIQKINEFLTFITLPNGRVIKLITDPKEVVYDQNDLQSNKGYVQCHALPNQPSLTKSQENKLKATKFYFKDHVKKWSTK